jgi:Tol biopolymer transport system component/tRNA A-37 threonylcarbamoyl transferase component Bud32
VTDVLARLQEALSDRYRLERELGQGGMATVYLAEDLKHHRKVALKVLRPEIAVTVGAGRFSREIEVAARLQHPNILPLLDSGEAEGFFFYVMPYVEGESLRDRLARGGELPVQDAVRILMEVADALSEAHAHGVVHRDIKPDNVMLRGRHALVADFGVAKAVTEATGCQVLTSAGVALGTPAYMAPEQATADPHQDHRVDIYALGVLGYELLTGRAPFAATTAQEMLAAHVTLAPDPIERWRPTVSPALAAVVMKCLSKKPADRWQSAEEVLQHLEPLATPSGGTTPTQTRPVIAFGNVPNWTKWAAGAIALGVLVLAVSRLLKPGPLTILASDVAPLTSDPGVEFLPAISPDGKVVAYASGPIGTPLLAIRSTAAASRGGEVRVNDTSFTSERFPRWSGDGESVRFWGCRSGACALYETGKLGGAVRPVTVPAHAGANGWRTAWSPDGSRLAFVNADTIFGASAGDSTVHPIVLHTGHVREFWFLHSLAWSPDGRRIAYVNGNPEWLYNGNVAESSIWVVDAAGGEPQQVTTAASLNTSPVWLDARHLLFVSNRDGPPAVYVVEVGPHGSRGEPRVVPGVPDPQMISYSAESRTLTFAKHTVRRNIWAYPLGERAPVSIRSGRPLTTGSQNINEHDLSPDGRWIALDNIVGGVYGLYKMPLAGGEAIPLTGRLPGIFPRWSPDGTEIAFYVGRAGTWSNWVMPAAGGDPVPLPEGPGLNFSANWSPDGLRITHAVRRHGRVECWMVSRDRVGGPWRGPVALGDFACAPGDWAPDGSGFVTSVGGESDPGVATMVLVAPDGRVTRRALPAASRLRLGGFLRFARDGRTIFGEGTHGDGRVGLWAIPAVGPGDPRLVIAYDEPALSDVRGVSVGRDRLYLTVSEHDSDIWVAKLRY